MQSHARVATERPARYMSQLVKPWSLRFQVLADEASARVFMPLGLCILTAGDGELDITVETVDAGVLARLDQSVAGYLNAFAHGDGELISDWARA